MSQYKYFIKVQSNIVVFDCCGQIWHYIFKTITSIKCLFIVYQNILTKIMLVLHPLYTCALAVFIKVYLAYNKKHTLMWKTHA